MALACLVVAISAPRAFAATTVALWHMNERSDTVMHDSVGNHNGTIHSVGLGVPGFLGSAYGSNGSSSYVSVPSAGNLDPGRAEGDELGTAVAISGSTAVGGAPGKDDASGAVSLFVRSSVVTTPPRGLKVFVGYVDNFHAHTGGSHPRPWRLSPRVIFKGCNYFTPNRCPKQRDRYDAGALRLQNAARRMIVTRARVTIGSCTFRPWPKLHVVVPAGKRLILTETGHRPPGPCHTTDKDNFDTSETHNNKVTQCTTNDGKIPVFRVRVNGKPLTFRDTGQILNTGGINPGAKPCGSRTETHAWAPIGS